jgi:uncharacterized protein (TIGR00369 family)
MAGKESPPPISKTLGMKLIEYGNGSATMTMVVDEKFHNPMGTLHGGVMTDLADASIGIALISTLEETESFTTLELKMNFIRPVHEDSISAQSKVLHRGRTIAVVESIVTKSDGKIVARGVATQMILKPQEKSDRKPNS